MYAIGPDGKALTAPGFLFGFRGRVSRGPYALVVFGAVFAVVLVAAGADAARSAGVISEDAVAFAVAAALVVSAYIQIAVGAKRCHDRDSSGWWQLLVLVLGGIFHLYWMLAPPVADDNAYGPYPGAG